MLNLSNKITKLEEKICELSNYQKRKIKVIDWLNNNSSSFTFVNNDFISWFIELTFDIKNFKSKLRLAEKSGDGNQAFIYENKFREANRQADAIKQKIHNLFDSTFRTNPAK